MSSKVCVWGGEGATPWKRRRLLFLQRRKPRESTKNSPKIPTFLSMSVNVANGVKGLPTFRSKVEVLYALSKIKIVPTTSCNENYKYIDQLSVLTYSDCVLTNCNVTQTCLFYIFIVYISIQCTVYNCSLYINTCVR